MMRGENACPSCQGDGNCAACYGSAVNTHLNEVEPKCRECHGTGTCQSCYGTGIASPTAGIIDLGLNKL
jgi:hypothetical protein